MSANRTIKMNRAPIRSAIAGLIVVGGLIAYKTFAPTVRVRVHARNDLRSEFEREILTGYDGYTPVYETVTVKINPDQIAVSMAEKMTGLSAYTSMLGYYKYIINDLTYNDLRLIHNSFLKLVDNKQSLYDWINAESEYNDVEVYQLEAMKKLSRAGVGQRNVLKIPHKDLLLV